VTLAPVAGGEPPAVVATHAIGDAAPTGRSGVEEAFRSGPRIVRVGGDDGPILLVLAFLAGFSAVWALQHRGGRVA
jgi:hypothetical protein